MPQSDSYSDLREVAVSIEHRNSLLCGSSGVPESESRDSDIDLSKTRLIESIFAGGGEMGARVRALDRSARVLGPFVAAPNPGNVREFQGTCRFQRWACSESCRRCPIPGSTDEYSLADYRPIDSRIRRSERPAVSSALGSSHGCNVFNH